MSSVINDTLLAIKAAFETGVNILNGGTAVSSSNPLPVVSKKTKRTSVTGLTVTNGAYTAKDVVGGLMTFTGALTSGIDTGLLQSISMNLKSAQTGVFVLHLFKSQPSTIADNGIFALTTADCLLKIASIPVTWVAANGSGSEVLSCYLASSLNIPIESTGGVIYGYLVCDSNVTFASTSSLVNVTLGVQLD